MVRIIKTSQLSTVPFCFSELADGICYDREDDYEVNTVINPHQPQELECETLDLINPLESEEVL